MRLLALVAVLTVFAQGRADYTGVKVKFRTRLLVILSAVVCYRVCGMRLWTKTLVFL